MSDSDDAPKQDVLGIISLVISLLTWLLCFGSCVPYLNILTMFPSMFMSLLGTVLGGAGIGYARNNDIEPGFSVAGLVMNGIPLFIWLCYWLFTILAMIVSFAFLFLMMAVAILSEVS